MADGNGTAMKLDVRLRNTMNEAAADAIEAQQIGFDGGWNTESANDAFLPLVLAAEHTDTLEIGTSVAIAFSRTPMTVAYTANELHRYSGGRFVLGLGSQIKPHITKRFSMPWSQPAVRMREFVLALRAIWRSWNDDEPLDFRGEFYTHTLMTPAFSPEPNEHGMPDIQLAAVGPRMTEVAGEVADGLLAHPFTTERYVREVTIPALERGRSKGSWDADLTGFDLGLSLFVAFDERDLEAVRRQISFYGSTPAYRPVLDLHGWGDLQTELNALSKLGKWDDMVGLVDDEIVGEMCASGSPVEIAAQINRRFGDVAQRVRFNIPGAVPAPSHFAELVDALR